MGTAFDSLVSGVPSTGINRSVFEQSDMNSGQQYALSMNRMATKSAILETRDRMERFRQAERARIEAPRAMSAVANLDPIGDPDYNAKVAGIIAENPHATLDPAFSNYLRYNDDVYGEAEYDRRREQDAIEWENRLEKADEKRRALDALQNESQLKKEEERLRNQAQAAFEKGLIEKIDKLPPEYQDRLATLVETDKKMTTDKALRIVERDLERDVAIDELISSGIPESEIGDKDENGNFIYGTGILKKDGTVDSRGKARIEGRLQAEEKEIERKEKLDKRLERMQEILEDQIGTIPDSEILGSVKSQRYLDLQEELNGVLNKRKSLFDSVVAPSPKSADDELAKLREEVKGLSGDELEPNAPAKKPSHPAAKYFLR